MPRVLLVVPDLPEADAKAAFTSAVLADSERRGETAFTACADDFEQGKAGRRLFRFDAVALYEDHGTDERMRRLENTAQLLGIRTERRFIGVVSEKS